MSGGGMLSPARGFGDVFLRGLIDSGAAPGLERVLGVGGEERGGPTGMAAMGTKPGAMGSVTPTGAGAEGGADGGVDVAGAAVGGAAAGADADAALGGSPNVRQTPPQVPKAAPKPQPKPKPPTVPQHNVARTIQILGAPGDYQQMMKGFASGATPADAAAVGDVGAAVVGAVVIGVAAGAGVRESVRVDFGRYAGQVKEWTNQEIAEWGRIEHELMDDLDRANDPRTRRVTMPLRSGHVGVRSRQKRRENPEGR